MTLKMQVDAERGGETNFFKGNINLKLEDSPLGAVFQFTLEMFEGDGESRPIFHVTENEQPVFTMVKLAGTHAVLLTLCRAGAELAIDLIEGQTITANYAATVVIADRDLAEVKKFLHDTSGKLWN